MNLENYPEELEGLFAKINDLLMERGVEAKAAAEAAFAITEFMRREWGGVAIYFRRAKGGGQKPELWKQEPLLTAPCALVTEPDPDARDYHAQLSARSAEILTGMGLEAGLATAIADMVRDDWAGHFVYVNKGISYEAFLRDAQIWREWDGSHRGKIELLKRYRISDVWFYKIVKRVRKREFHRTQPALPGVVGEDR